MGQMADFFINMGVTALFVFIKNPESKAKYKAISLKVYRKIKEAFAGDPDFEA